LEVGGCFRRYHTAMMRTAIMGELSDSMYKAQELMKYALCMVHENIQPGMTVSDVDNMVRAIITSNTVGAQLITRSGYSIGIAFPPSWDEGYILSLKQGNSAVLEEGMTFHIIPWMWGVDGDKTCGISDTIYITETGCESFFSLDLDFTVKNDQGKKHDSGGKRQKPAAQEPAPVPVAEIAPPTRKTDPAAENAKEA